MLWGSTESQRELDRLHFGTSEMTSVPREGIRLCLWQKGVVHETAYIGICGDDDVEFGVVSWTFLGWAQ